MSEEINGERREHSALGLNEGENLLGSKPLEGLEVVIRDKLLVEAIAEVAHGL